MAHYAFIKDNLVTEVITGKDETETAPDGFADWEEYYLSKRPGMDACKRTSYNTIANTHTAEGTPFRGNYAGIGHVYDTDNDVFYAPQPFDSWTLDSNWVWQPPVAYPSDANYEQDTSLPIKHYSWNELTNSWVLLHTEVYNSETELWEIS